MAHLDEMLTRLEPFYEKIDIYKALLIVDDDVSIYDGLGGETITTETITTETITTIVEKLCNAGYPAKCMSSCRNEEPRMKNDDDSITDSVLCAMADISARLLVVPCHAMLRFVRAGQRLPPEYSFVAYANVKTRRARGPDFSRFLSLHLMTSQLTCTDDRPIIFARLV
jgi:hypothetical protein